MPNLQRPLPTPAIQAPLNFSIEHETFKTFVEYALILGLVVVLVIVGLILLGPIPSAVTNLGSAIVEHVLRVALELVEP